MLSLILLEPYLCVVRKFEMLKTIKSSSIIPVFSKGLVSQIIEQ